MKKFFTIMMIMLGSAANAQEICNSKTAGMLQCMAGKQCECRLHRTSLLNNEPGGYKWDCGILQPTCIDTNVISDRGAAGGYDGPEAVYIERNNVVDVPQTTGAVVPDEPVAP